MINVNKFLWSFASRDFSNSKEFKGFFFLTVLSYGILVLLPSLRHYPVFEVSDYFLIGFSWIFIVVVSGLLIYFSAMNRWIFAVFFPVFIVSTGAISFYISTYNLVVNAAVIDSTLNTNNAEAFSQVSMYLLVYILLLFSVSLLFVLIRLNIKGVKINWLNIVLVTTGLVIVFTLCKPNVVKAFKYSPYSLVFGIRESLGEGNYLPKTRKDISGGAVCHSDSLTVVFVVGEAMRADHVSLNGYSRETFPLMKRDDPVSFKNIYSEWTYTIKSLPHIFTRADSINHWPSTHEKTFISIFNSCNYKSWWFGNQDLNRYLLPLASECDSLKLFSWDKNEKRLDGQMLPAIKNAVNSTVSRKLIVVHQFGCHWWYPSNTPEEFEKFTPALKSKSITNEDSMKIVNSYDNLACYTDYFLSKIVEMLKEKNAVMIYLSDHGELLGEEGKWIHAQQTKYEKNPACMIWFSEKYRQKFPFKVNASLQNKDKHFRSDFLFHTILDAGEIESPVYIEKLDLFKTPETPASFR
jgi:glucan phosphoethanolaminetransferase (alkaline phosphatase superfamily)